MNADDASQKVAELIEESIARFEKIKSIYSIDTDQPMHASWVTIDSHFTGFGQDSQTAIRYGNASEMQLQLLRLVEEVFTAELLEFIRSGSVIDLTLRIGPNTLWDSNLNEEDDFDFVEERV